MRTFKLQSFQDGNVHSITSGMSEIAACPEIGFPWAQMVKSLPAVRETRVRSLDREGLLEKEMANHSSILVWKIPWMEEPSQLQSIGLQRVGHN